MTAKRRCFRKCLHPPRGRKPCVPCGKHPQHGLRQGGFPGHMCETGHSVHQSNPCHPPHAGRIPSMCCGRFISCAARAKWNVWIIKATHATPPRAGRTPGHGLQRCDVSSCVCETGLLVCHSKPWHPSSVLLCSLLFSHAPVASASMSPYPITVVEHYRTCKRYNVPGHAHSLTFSCCHRRALLQDDSVKLLLVKSIAAARERHRFDLWAYVIMPDHVHLLIFPRQEVYSISTILAGIKRPVAYQANRLLGRVSKARSASDSPSDDRFWQGGGGYDRNLWKAAAIHAEIAYLHGNPVRKGLCASTEDWRFSSAGFWAGRKDVPLAMDRTVPALGPVREI